MTINDYFNKLCQVMAQETNYEAQRPMIQEYKAFLEGLHKEDPSNIKAVCQLAIMKLEDREDVDDCLALMDDALETYEASMSDQDLCELLNNLAYFYDEEYNQTEKAINYLKRAVTIGACQPKTYFGLTYLLADADLDSALEWVKTLASQVDTDPYYRYLKAYILMKSGEYGQALDVFQDLSGEPYVEIREKSLYSMSLIKSLRGDHDGAYRIANDLYDSFIKDQTQEIMTFELINVYYSLGDYKRVVDLYQLEKESLYLDTESMAQYIYALKMTGQETKCQEVYDEKIKELQEDNQDTLQDDDFSPEEKAEYIADNDRELETLEETYKTIMTHNQRPEVKEIFLGTGICKRCYLIGCGRHL